jgi:hypothetical protein
VCRFGSLPRGDPVPGQSEGQSGVLFDALGYGEFRCLRAVALDRSREGAPGGVGQRQFGWHVFLELTDEPQVLHAQVERERKRRRHLT